MLDGSRFDIRLGIQQMCRVYVEHALRTPIQHSAVGEFGANKSA
jgi:hypothetical protein